MKFRNVTLQQQRGQSTWTKRAKPTNVLVQSMICIQDIRELLCCCSTRTGVPGLKTSKKRKTKNVQLMLQAAYSLHTQVPTRRGGAQKRITVGIALVVTGSATWPGANRRRRNNVRRTRLTCSALSGGRPLRLRRCTGLAFCCRLPPACPRPGRCPCPCPRRRYRT